MPSKIDFYSGLVQSKVYIFEIISSTILFSVEAVGFQFYRELVLVLL